MGFFLEDLILKPPFDIWGDLDTPVSAFMKLSSLNPRFLLESVEGGERLARYSFIGFGDCLELKVSASGVTIGGQTEPLPNSGAELLNILRRGLARAPRPLPDIAGVPLAGGLVGYASYDVVRFFERLPARRSILNAVPAMHYVAPASLLVFDHLTRSIALLHAGSEAERRSLRNEVIRALHCGVQPRRLHVRRVPHPGVHRIRGCLSARAVGALRRTARA